MPHTAYLGIDIAKRKFDVALAPPGRHGARESLPRIRPPGTPQLLAWVARHHTERCMRVWKPRVRMGSRWRRPWRRRLYGQRRQPGHDRGVRAEPARAHENRPHRCAAIAQFCRDAAAPTVGPAAARGARPSKRSCAGLTRSRACGPGAQSARRGARHAVIRASIQHVIDLLEDEMATLRARIHDHFDQHPDLRAQRDLLTSIPGIGEATAASCSRSLGLSALSPGAACAAFAGVVPRLGASPALPSAWQTGAVETRRARPAQSALLSGHRRLAAQPHHRGLWPAAARQRQTQDGGHCRRHAQARASRLWRH